MSLDLQPAGARARVTAEERERVRAIASAVARAARILLKHRRTHIPRSDLEALGMLAVWRQLAAYDPARGSFDLWVFYRAFGAMIDVSRTDQRQTSFEAEARRGAQGYVAQDDRPAQRDLDNDTPETDLGRLCARTRRIGVSAWFQTMLENVDEGAPVERKVTAAEAVRIVREELARLSEERRTYLHLRFWDQTEVLHVVERMGIPERTLRRRWAETRDLLERRLRARGVLGIPEGFGEAVDELASDEEASQ